MDIQISKERYYFGFRFENTLKERIISYCKQQTVNLNTLVEIAMENICRLHDKKMIHLNKAASNFRGRFNTRDRIDTMLILKAAVREHVWNLAVCYRRSMAEIIRIALELFLDATDSKISKSDDIKHYYSKPQYIIECTIIGLYPFYPPKPPPDTNRTVIQTC